MRRGPMNLDYPRPHEGAMLQRQLQQMVDDACALQAALQPGDDVPAWTIKKIATAQDRLQTASNYLRQKIRSRSNLGALPARRRMIAAIGSDPLDTIKPYVPWLAGLAFVGLLVYSGGRTPSPKRRRSRATTRRRR